MINKIIPLVERCKCGEKVTSHHRLCDSCWGKRCKNDVILARKKILLEGMIAEKRRLNEFIDPRTVDLLKKVKIKLNKIKIAKGLK